MSAQSFDPPGGGLGFALMQAANAWRAELAHVLGPVELTPSQFFVLAMLQHTRNRGRPDPTQKQVSDRTGIDVNTTSQVVRGLERRGLVRRAVHPDDSRAIALSLTDPGIELARECTRMARALNRRYFAEVDGEPLLATLSGLAEDSRARVRG